MRDAEIPEMPGEIGPELIAVVRLGKGARILNASLTPEQRTAAARRAARARWAKAKKRGN